MNGLFVVALSKLHANIQQSRSRSLPRARVLVRGCLVQFQQHKTNGVEYEQRDGCQQVYVLQQLRTSLAVDSFY